MFRKKMMWILPLLLVALLVAACDADGGGDAGLEVTDAEVEGIPQTDEEAAEIQEDLAEGTDVVTTPGAEGADAGMGDRVEVAMINTTFEPNEITVQPGTTVVWTNEDTFAHTVTSGAGEIADGMFDSGTLESGQTYEYTFDEPGIYEYFCSLHPGMVGTVVVQ
jgi:plastocyanin